MPLVPAAIGLASLYALFRAVLGSPLVEPFFAWFMLGYLAYDYTHLAIHCRSPRTRLGTVSEATAHAPSLRHAGRPLGRDIPVVGLGDGNDG